MKLTAPQREVLGELKKGAVLHSCFHSHNLSVSYFLSDHKRKLMKAVHQRTFFALLDRKLIKCKHDDGPGGKTYIKTKAGLKVLE